MSPVSPRPYRLLFVKQQLAHPRASGHDIRCFEMLRAFRKLGHDVALATIEPCDAVTRNELGVPLFSLLQEQSQGKEAPPLRYWQERFRSYWGIPKTTIAAVSRIAAQFDADAVIGLGLDVLPILAGAGDRGKVWYAGDEWVTHHLSQFKPLEIGTYGELRAALVKGLYQRAFAGSLERAWVVSSTEQRAMQRWGGVAHVDAIANGVDTDFFTPQHEELIDCSAIFWGRLDFGPNIHAIDWLCDRIWPQVLARVPSARLTIMGFNASPAVMARAAMPGVEIRTDVPDIRPYVGRHQVALLPMVSGGGIKNKLLEAAALGKAIVCTSMACSGLRGTPPAVIVDDEREWVDAITRLWTSPAERQQLETSARAWILDSHTWEAAAREALRGLDQSRPRRQSAAIGESPAIVRGIREPRLLFVKRSLASPRASGHDVCCFELLRAVRRAGHTAALTTIIKPDDRTLRELDVPWFPLTASHEVEHAALPLTYLQDRYRSYWGVSFEMIAGVTEVSRKFDATAVVGVGLEALPYLATVTNRTRVWYAADEWTRHHLSQASLLRANVFTELRSAIVKGLYERVYSKCIDRAWVVSEAERRAMHFWAGVRHVDVIANGVDTDFFAPSPTTAPRDSAVFWGRLDFGPNIQALQWFCRTVWPRLLRERSGATFTVMGFNATPEVTRLAAAPGIKLVTNVPDIRLVAQQSDVVVLPMLSGGGIKNKLLEAAALGKPIVCTETACSGLRGELPAIIANDTQGWVNAIRQLWDSEETRTRLGAQARAWVMAKHSWGTAAHEAIQSLERASDEQ